MFMHYVYILRSETAPRQTYVGYTSDIEKRLKSHNRGAGIHTNKFKPWFVEFYAAFSSKQKAMSFERYLKTGSGIAFARKRF